MGDTTPPPNDFDDIPWQGIIEQSLAGIFLIQDGRYRYVNETFAQMAGCQREQMIGAAVKDLAGSSEQAAMLMARIERRLGGENTGRFIAQRFKRGNPGFIEIHGARVMYRGRPAVIALSIDITEQEQQREELLASRAQLQELISNANAVKEKERARVAQELHDVVGGMLTTIKFDLSRLSWRIEELQTVDARPKASSVKGDSLAALSATAAQLRELVQETIDAVRGISEGLHLGMLTHLTLSDTLTHDLGRFAKRYGISCQLDMTGTPVLLDQDRKLDIYRIFQEALTNVARHSKATEVHVRMDWQDHELTLEITDNGLGPDNDQTDHRSRFGILGMKERARHLSGTLEMGTGPKGGTRVLLCVPLNDVPANPSEAKR